MDAQLRQRLIGAAVLVALAVIFLPMLLSSRKPVASEEVSLALPPQGGQPVQADERTVTLPAERSSTAPQADPDAVALVDTTSAPALVEPEPAPVQEPARGPAPIQREPAVAAQPPVVPAPAPPAPAPAPPRFDAAAASPGGAFFLQLGSYSQAPRAQALVDQLATLGIQARSDRFDSNGRTLYRVRSGGYPNRTAAEAARLKAVAAVRGLVASVAEGAVPTATAPSRTPSGGAVAWAVQYGVFSVEGKARELSDKLKRAGFAAYVERIQAANGPALRVRVGPATREAQARTLRDQVKSKLGLDGLVVPHP